MDWMKRCVFPKDYTYKERPRLLLTGSNGLVGQAVLRAVAQAVTPEWTVIACGRGAPRGLSLTVPYVSIDVADSMSFGPCLQELAPAYVLHAAAMTQVDECEIAHMTAYNQNVQAVETLLAAIPSTCFVLHLSTDFVFDGTQSPYAEDATYSPCNYYGLTKQYAEQRLQTALQPWTVVRTSLVYGYGESLRRLPFLSQVKKRLKKGEHVRMVDDQWRQPTFVDDLATACLRLLTERKEGIFHISGEERFTPYEMVCTAARDWGYDLAYVHAVSTDTFATPATRPKETIFCLDKAKKELGYSTHTLKEALQSLEVGEHKN